MSLETKDLVAAFKRRPLVFICGGVVIALGLALYFRSGVGDELQARLAEREKEFARMANNTKFSAQLDAQLQALREANATLETGALRVGELARNQQVFFRLEEQTGVKLLDIRPLNINVPAKAGPATTYVGIPFSLTIKGEYPQLIDFLQRLDRGATLARVTSASVAPPDEGIQTLSLGVELLGFRP